MIELLQAIWTYRPLLWQRLAGVGNKSDSFSWMEQGPEAQIDAAWIPRWSGYLTLIQFVGKWAQGLEGGGVNYSDKMAQCLAAFIALYDDYTDDYNLKHREILKVLNAPEPKGDRQKLAVYLYREILEMHPNADFFQELLELGGAAQDLSLKQKEANTSAETLWEVTHKKGGYFTLICFSAFIEKFSQKQQDYIYELGANIQLLNDTFDVYKDTQAGIFTLPNTTSSVAEFATFYEERILEWIKTEIPFHIEAAGQRKLRAEFALPFVAGFICLKQYKELEKTHGKFDPKTLSRKELVCDMDSIPKVMETLKIARELLSK